MNEVAAPLATRLSVVDKIGVDKIGVDKMGVDKMGVNEMGRLLSRNIWTPKMSGPPRSKYFEIFGPPLKFLDRTANGRPRYDRVLQL